MIKRILEILAIVAIACVVLGGVIALLPLLTFFGVNTMPDHPKPAITYQEFPFKLEYEQNRLDRKLFSPGSRSFPIVQEPFLVCCSVFSLLSHRPRWPP